MVREYRRRCNTVENIHKVIGSWDRVIFVWETEESAACPITKPSKNSRFHIPLIFVLYFHSQFQRFFSLFDTFSHLRNLRKRVQRRVTGPQGTCFVRSTMISPVRRGYCMDGWPKSNTPCCYNFFFFFFPLPFSKAIWKTAELPSLRNIVSSLYRLFVPRFAMAVFMCIHLHCRRLSSILWTVDLSKDLITAWIFQKFIQLDNFVTLLSLFGNRVRSISVFRLDFYWSLDYASRV